MLPLPKAHTSALCLVPPASSWRSIQALRVFNDKGFARWMPHVNLLYPFHADDGGPAFAACAGQARAALQDVQPFKVTLSRPQFFDHGRSCTLWLDPCSPELLELQQRLVEAFPECRDLSDDPGRGITRFVPHLSLGQWRSREDAQRAAQALAASWQDVEFGVSAVHLISRTGYTSPFVVRYSVDLGPSPGPASSPQEASPQRPPPRPRPRPESPQDGGRPPRADAREGSGASSVGDGDGSTALPAGVQRLDLPYVATLADNEQRSSGSSSLTAEGPGASGTSSGSSTSSSGCAPASLLVSGGSGGGGGGGGCSTASVWWFSYGEGMAAAAASSGAGSQLAAALGPPAAAPLESRRAFLPGYRLVFSHVGGLANVEPLMGPTQEGNQLRSSATVASMTSVTAPCGSNGAEPSARLQPQPRPQPEQDHGQEQEQKQGQGQAGVHGVAHRLSVFDASRLVLAQYERWPCEVWCEVEAGAAAETTGGACSAGTGGCGDMGADGRGASAGVAPTGPPPPPQQQQPRQRSWVCSLVFRSPPERQELQDDSLPPDRGHKQAVCAAARRALLEPAYCSWLEALPAVDDAGAAVQPAYRSAPAWRNRRTGADKLRAGPRAAARLV